MQRKRSYHYGTVYYSRSIGVLTAIDFNKINEHLEQQLQQLQQTDCADQAITDLKILIQKVSHNGAITR
ncbi:hypothetical protein [Acinetobacter junii]|uniref:hypothetical protein n=1 Tax=Acinetobacter junii TaxID=40215 RepID=UPI000FA965F5|nr:hypothetical protein [Acinetobacter junii]RSE35108.1 hypothetical protein EGT62_03970 [Acinetobacter junii]RSE35116.1 hypothetical protein EGT62_04015 [Acinetobacter junii]